jgi:hypothetical protein
VILTSALLFSIGLCSVNAEHVVLVVDTQSKAVEEARAALSADGHSVDVVTSDKAPLNTPDDGAIWLAAGPKSAALLGRASQRKRAAFMLRAAESPANVPAVVLDVAIVDQLGWIGAAFPGRTRVVVPRDPSRASFDEALTNAAKAAGLEINIVDVRAPGEAVPAVQQGLKKGSAPAIVLLVPDATVVTADTIAPLAKTALDARVPIVGFASYFLRVGALAAVSFETPAAARMALELARGGSIEQRAPPGARLVVDGKLAERLGVAVRTGPGIEVKR